MNSKKIMILGFLVVSSGLAMDNSQLKMPSNFPAELKMEIIWKKLLSQLEDIIAVEYIKPPVIKQIKKLLSDFALQGKNYALWLNNQKNTDQLLSILGKKWKLDKVVVARSIGTKGMKDWLASDQGKKALDEYNLATLNDFINQWAASHDYDQGLIDEIAKKHDLKDFQNSGPNFIDYQEDIKNAMISIINQGRADLNKDLSSTYYVKPTKTVTILDEINQKGPLKEVVALLKSKGAKTGQEIDAEKAKKATKLFN